MTAENNFNVKPLTNVSYVAPANPSGEQPGHNNRKFKRKPAQSQDEDSTQAADDGDDIQHVIDYCA